MFPLSKMKRLSDWGGRFVLSVQCLRCEHDRPIPASALVQKCGDGALVADIVKRLKCSQCACRAVDVGVVGIPR